MHHRDAKNFFCTLSPSTLSAKMLPGQDSSFHTSRCSRCNIRSRTRSEWRCTPARKYLSKDEKYKPPAQNTNSKSKQIQNICTKTKRNQMQPTQIQMHLGPWFKITTGARARTSPSGLAVDRDLTLKRDPV